MADIQLRQQFPAAPDLSVGADWSEFDVWAREQFPSAPDVSCYPELRWGIRDAAGAPAALTLTLAASEASDAAAFAITVVPFPAIDFVLGTTEAADTASFAMTVTDAALAMSLAASETADSAFFSITAQAPAILHGGGYWPEVKRDRRLPERDALRAMLEAAFADAPRDPVIAKERREHRVIASTGAAVPRTDWTRLLGDLTACAAILDRYAERIGREATQTQRGEKPREDLRYSLESVEEMLDQVREFAAERRRVRRRAAIALLM